LAKNRVYTPNPAPVGVLSEIAWFRQLSRNHFRVLQKKSRLGIGRPYLFWHGSVVSEESKKITV
jgi:hypothetical protein